jgi:hypothetical protein
MVKDMFWFRSGAYIVIIMFCKFGSPPVRVNLVAVGRETCILHSATYYETPKSVRGLTALNILEFKSMYIGHALLVFFPG